MVYALILAAGSGKRMKTKQKKQFYKIKNKPVFLYSIDNFLKIKKINKIYINFNKSDINNSEINNFIKTYKKFITNGKINIIFNGGKERYDSVYNAMNIIKNDNNIKRNDLILIHDSARVLFDINDVNKLIYNLPKLKAITLASKSIETLKTVKNDKNVFKKVINTLDRNIVYNIKTPQGFNFNLLFNAYSNFYKDNNKNKTIITDDIMIIEKYTKLSPYILETNKVNIKITTKEDLKLIKNLINI